MKNDNQSDRVLMSNKFSSSQMDFLREIYRENELARHLFDKHSACQTSKCHLQVETLLKNMKLANTNWNRGKAVALFRAMEGHGFGKFILGRGTKKSRFQFSESPKEMAKVAKARGSKGDLGKKQKTVAPPILQDVYVHQIQIRPKVSVSMLLPADLKTSEADRVDQFLRALPMPDNTNGSGANTQVVKHEFLLRHDSPALFELPVDLKMHEAISLGTVITGLAS